MVRSRPEKTGPRCPHTKSASTKVSTSKNMCKGNKTWKNPISQFGLSIFWGYNMVPWDSNPWNTKPGSWIIDVQQG